MPGANFAMLLAGAPKVNPTMTFGSSGSQTADGTSMTVASLSIGTANATRKVIAAVGWSASTDITISSATIGGVSATVVLSADAATGSCGAALIIADVPTGTTASVVVNFSGTCSRMYAATYYVTNLNSSTAYATANATSGSSGVASVNCNVPANGFAIAMASTIDGSSYTWTGLTEDGDTFPESSSAHSSASGSFASAQTPLAVTSTASSGSRQSLVVASWGN